MFIKVKFYAEIIPGSNLTVCIQIRARPCEKLQYEKAKICLVSLTICVIPWLSTLRLSNRLVIKFRYVDAQSDHRYHFLCCLTREICSKVKFRFSVLRNVFFSARTEIFGAPSVFSLRTWNFRIPSIQHVRKLVLFIFSFFYSIRSWEKIELFDEKTRENWWILRIFLSDTKCPAVSFRTFIATRRVKAPFRERWKQPVKFQSKMEISMKKVRIRFRRIFSRPR